MESDQEPGYARGKPLGENAVDRPIDSRRSARLGVLGSSKSNGPKATAEPALRYLGRAVHCLAGAPTRRRLEVFQRLCRDTRFDSGLLPRRWKSLAGKKRRPVIKPAHGARSQVRRHKAWTNCPQCGHRKEYTPFRINRETKFRDFLQIYIRC